MRCEDVQDWLTAYLDGELDADRGSVVRGHLRTCETCRGVAGDEAALRDGLRDLPLVDPPASLWAGVQARLAEAEVADAQRPAWRAALGRWLRGTLWSPRSGMIGLAVCAAAVLVIVHHTRATGDEATQVAVDKAGSPAVVPPPTAAPVSVDVTADLGGDTARATASYAAAANELVAFATDARASWPEDRKQAFDAKLAELRRQIDGAGEGRAQQRAYRAMIRYLQGVTIRDEIAQSEPAMLATPKGTP